MSESTDLILVAPTSLVAAFTEPGGVEAIIQRVETAARAEAARHDISTEKGRDALKSLARSKIASSKVAFIKAGKDLTEQWRLQVAAVNADCKLIETRLDALRDEIRKPVMDLENAEKARVDGHETAIAAIIRTAEFIVAEPSIEEIDGRLEYLGELMQRDWKEFASRATRVADTARLDLQTIRARMVALATERAELARLRAEQEERDRIEAIRLQVERERQIAAQAAETARLAAEQKAQEELDAAQCQIEKAQATAAQAERNRIETEQRAARELLMQQQAAETARIAAEKAAHDAQDRAIEAERKRVADEVATAERQRVEREADKAHQGKINREVMADLMACVKMTEETAKAIVKAMALGQVRHVKIGY